jgi:MYXO-CTERM domain-containing protein
MRQSLLLGTVAVAGLASLASAHGTALDLKFSKTAGDGGAWLTNITANPGETVYVRVEMTIDASYYGISGARYNVISTNAGGWDVGGNDSIELLPGKGSATDGRYAGFDFGGQTQQVYEAAGSLRIDAKGDNANNPNAGISTSQNTPGALGTNFNTNTQHVPVYKFAVKLSDNTEVGRQIVLAILGSQITSFKGYETSSSTAGVQINGAEGDTGTITIVPAPGALAAVGIAGLAAIRRRR